MVYIEFLNTIQLVKHPKILYSKCIKFLMLLNSFARIINLIIKCTETIDIKNRIVIILK